MIHQSPFTVIPGFRRGFVEMGYGLGETLSKSIFHGFVSLRVLNKNTILKQHLMYININSVFISANLYLKMKENANWKAYYIFLNI